MTRIAELELAIREALTALAEPKHSVWDDRPKGRAEDILRCALRDEKQN